MRLPLYPPQVDIDSFTSHVSFVLSKADMYLRNRDFAALGGGLTPLIATALVTWANGSYWPAPAWLAALAFVSLCTALFAPETRNRSLKASEGGSH